MVKRVVIAGSRYFNNYDFFCSKVDFYLSHIQNQYELIILSGHCSGVDQMAERYAKEHGFALELFPAEWERYGKSAGLRRNRQMVELADYAIAFPGGGSGTKSLIQFSKKGIPTKVIPVKA